ncbi:hypothetical protein [Oryzihumus sp.]|uniref:hypothetical protein n=1 Tax=Oryzihumus sp. TaxID=1968903 RepID=UPI002ED8A6A2
MSARSRSALATLLRVRTIAEEAARAQLGAAAAQQGLAAAALQRSREQLSDAPAAAAPASVEQFLWGRSRMEARAASVHRAVVTEAATRQALEERRCLWSEAAQRMTAIERLEERAREAERLAQLAQDQQVGEEIAATRAGERR